MQVLTPGLNHRGEALTAQRFGLGRRRGCGMEEETTKVIERNQEVATEAMVGTGEENLLSAPWADAEQGFYILAGNPGRGSGVTLGQGSEDEGQL